jgi:hypothetical protein
MERVVGPPDVVILSLGAGVQSSTLYRMAALGELDKVPDYAIFADTKQEPHWVYENLDSLEKDHGNAIPIIRATAGDLGEAIVKGVNTTGGRFASVPFWVKREDGTEAPGGRQCTREYKIDVVKKAVRELLGLKPRQRASGRVQVEEWVGISRDEAHRMKPSRYDWIHTRWPLIELMMSRQACKWWLEERGYTVPGKSACVFCPYRRLAEYARWREEEPELFEEACQMDDLIRSSGTMKGMRGQQFVLRTLVPLREVPLPSELNGDGPHQMDLFGEECEGMCGV